ncbi:MAG: hypothetical protein AAF916_12415 [Planctomycetota bacterium]
MSTAAEDIRIDRGIPLGGDPKVIDLYDGRYLCVDLDGEVHRVARATNIEELRMALQRAPRPDPAYTEVTEAAAEAANVLYSPAPLFQYPEEVGDTEPLED